MKTSALRTLLDADLVAAAATVGTFNGLPVVAHLFFPDQTMNTKNRPIIQMMVEENEAAPASFGSPGSNVYRVSGVLTLHVMTPVNSGTGLSDHIITALETYYTGRTTTDFRYRTPRTSGPGFRLGSDWRATLIVPFRADRRS